MVYNSYTTRMRRLLSRIYCKWGGLTLKLPPAVIDEYIWKNCNPPTHQIFRAFELCPFNNVKVVIIGQDPYYNPGKANGLAFSQNWDPAPTDSLYIINQNLNGIINNPDLESWAKQGVLLMNSLLSVRYERGNPNNSPKTHKGYGWEKYVDDIIDILIKDTNPKVFLLWGNEARDKVKRRFKSQHHTTLFPKRNPNRHNYGSHLYLFSAHPSKKNATKKKNSPKYPFTNNGHFKDANIFLSQNYNGSIIDWSTK